MKIIGHRGAAGLALENTLESIRAGREAGADAIEIDVRLTQDGHFVLAHDPNTARVSDDTKFIPGTTLKELRRIKLHNGERVPTLTEAIRAVGDTRLIVEAKNGGWAQALAATLDKKAQNITVIAFNHNELAAFASLRPDIPTYALEHWSPVDVIRMAQREKFTGVDLNLCTLNPLTYWLARRAGLEIIVFTVNYTWLAKFLKALYPQISITTNYPDKLQVLR